MRGNDEDQMGEQREIPDEMLMAFADGELSDHDRKMVENAIGADPAVAARVALFIETRARVGGAFASVMRQRPPDRLFDAAMNAGTQAAASPAPSASALRAPFGRAAANENRPMVAWRPVALAAAIAGVAAGIAGYMAGGAGSSSASALAALGSATSAVEALLSSPAEGQVVPLPGHAATASVTGTHRMRDGRICRAVDVRHQHSGTGAEAIGCRDGSRWRLEVASPRSLADGSFRPAGGGGAIDAFLDAGGAGPSLPPSEVERISRENWR
jgi:anti-sigma factor RsiW